MPDGDHGQPDPRIAVARFLSEQLEAHNPALMAAHPLVADEVNEEVLLMEMSFECITSCCYTYHLPSHYAWLTARHSAEPYRSLRIFLQYLQWQDGGGRGRPWVLKSPLHLGYLDKLFDAFPGALIVHCHRHPSFSVPSICAALEATRQGCEVDPLELGRFFSEHLSGEMAKYAEQRRLLERRERFVDVPYKTLQADPLGVVRLVYKRLGRPLSAQELQPVDQWLAANPQHRFGKHEYSMERYGLTAESIATAFAPYIEQFGLEH
jgi:hypothetical protein